MRIKPGVSIVGIQPPIIIALIICDGIYAGMGYELVVTSGTEGKHRPRSLHYVGFAVDIRIRDFNFPEEEAAAFNYILLALGAEFDVILHKRHIHIEFQPKKGVNLAN